MFQDMRRSGIVVGIGLEPDGEDIVLVISCYVNVVCPRLIVLQLDGSKLQFGNALGSLHREAVEFVAGLRKLFQIGDSGIGSFRNLGGKTSVFTDRKPREG